MQEIDKQLTSVLAWIDEHREDALTDLQRYCRQPSIAAQNVGMEKMAEIVAEGLRELHAEVHFAETGGYPVIVGKLTGESPRRLAIYNHYDAQPPEPLEEWSSPPFEAEIRDGKLYARGVADNKGNLVARLWAAKAWLAVHGTLPCHLTFLFEGEEEIGSPHLEEFAATNQTLIQADGCLWETGYHEEGQAPALYAGVKGMLYIELQARTVSHDLHSSNAPLAPNAIWRLLEALQTLRDENGRVAIPGFYDAVKEPTKVERELMRRFPVDTEALKQQWQVDKLLGNDNDPAAETERLLFQPTCNICGIWGGYSGPGSKTILPAKATCKVDLRLVPDQEPQTILRLLKDHLRQRGFSDIEVIEMEGESKPGQSSIESSLMEALVRSAKRVYGSEPPVRPRTAGTGPMEQVCQRYNIPVAGGAGVGYTGSRIHAPNENIKVEDFILGIKHVAALLAEFGR